MDASHRAITGCLLGMAAGDALGLPREGLAPQRALRLFGQPDRHQLVCGRWGMVSDDTEHACLVAQALIAAGDDVGKFSRQLARGLRRWLLSCPAGTGMATVKAVAKLCVGFSPARSGVFSAGNGPAMRSPLLGVAVADLGLLRQFVRVSTRLTHTDPKAEQGALAVALAARLASDGVPVDPGVYHNQLRQLLTGKEATGDSAEFLELVERAIASAATGESTEHFAAGLGLSQGVTGYMFHTVPVVLQAWLRFPLDFRAAVLSVIRCGGDTDTTAAIVGGMVGSGTGPEGVPAEWLAGLLEWPRTVSWMKRLASQLAEVRSSGTPAKPPRLPAWGLLPRNGAFGAIVLAHGFRRLLPPY